MREIDYHTDSFSEFYRDSRGFRIFTYIVILFGCIGFVSSSDEYLLIPKDEQGGVLWLVLLPSYMLLHNFLTDRQSFYWSIPVGVAWAILGNSLVLPFWMATAALLLSLLTQFRANLLWKALLWGIPLISYAAIFDNLLAAYPFYVVFLVIVVIARKMIASSAHSITPIKAEPAATHTSEVSYKEYLHNQQLKQQKSEDENIVSSFRPPRDEPDEPQPAPKPEPKIVSSYRPPRDEPDEPKPVPKPEPKIVSSYRPPRDAVEDESPNAILVAKTAPVKKVFRPAKDDYAGLLLMLEKKTLPAAMQTELQGIIKNARMILTSMEEDPEDVKPGNAFLSRYMPALESVVEQVEKLAALESLSSSSKQAMDKCFHALQGLRSAFAQQYEQLQENNQLKFNVEMEMLDSLLKTDGFK